MRGEPRRRLSDGQKWRIVRAYATLRGDGRSYQESVGAAAVRGGVGVATVRRLVKEIFDSRRMGGITLE